MCCSWTATATAGRRRPRWLAALPSRTARTTQAEAGDALCQVCLVLATLAAVAGPVAWGWAVQRLRGTAPQPLAQAAPLRRAWAPYRARGPPGLPATA
jgi:hypothetical protein